MIIDLVQIENNWVERDNNCKTIREKLHLYGEYIFKSEDWKRIRELILLIDNYECKMCGDTNSLNVHHIKYEGVLYRERLNTDKVIVLCRRCHKKVHQTSKGYTQTLIDKYFVHLKDKILDIELPRNNIEKEEEIEIDIGKDIHNTIR